MAFTHLERLAKDEREKAKDILGMLMEINGKREEYLWNAISKFHDKEATNEKTKIDVSWIV